MILFGMLIIGNTIDGSLFYWEQDLSVMAHHTEDYAGGYATYTISAKMD